MTSGSEADKPRTIPIGSGNAKHPKPCINGSIWKKVCGEFESGEADGAASQVIYNALTTYPDLVLVTGGPLTNVYSYLKTYEKTDQVISLWIGQGGFAGANVVPEQNQLSKFKGMTTCPTFNFNGNIKAADYCLNSKRIKRKLLVSKNVCHGCICNEAFFTQLTKYKNSNLGLNCIHQGLSVYAEKKNFNKKLHDLLAAACVVQENIVVFKPVQMSHNNTKYGVEWGCQLAPNSDVFISVHYDPRLFFNTVAGI
ncbi:inosine-uridine preferring nucleoside hydrolase superfamily [Reticulomyxa filosa]|uniref:Inosine-uridine preferring nucleoside hydrolase superfamily n=1 Tax=Reticulomyxa filosa TaxID=46433 RepID=X6M8U5_RETFI|nr:inosine-uridine preferring nucleoside hydrolase superfamily [Reticulomyxa filosa]|eukprot:ETO09440.1 inosine-uridine preferring nucleoside hydrolase superfamily [Reticulomyxa filosa]